MSLRSTIERRGQELEHSLDEWLHWLGNVRPQSTTVSYLVLSVGSVLMLLSICGIAWSAWGFMTRVARDAAFYVTVGIYFVQLAVSIVAGGFAYRLINVGRGRIARLRALAMDTGQPIVLYLRSFKDDVSTGRAVSQFDVVTEEEHLIQALNGVAPVLAIGMPGEELPQLGATRVKVARSDWKGAVMRWMSQAALVVFRIGETSGFWWEVEQSLRIVSKPKTIFIVPHGRARYVNFVERLKQLDPDLKVASYRTRATEGGVSIAALLAFDSERSLGWHDLGLPRSKARKLVEPLAFPFARAVGAILGKRITPRGVWLARAMVLSMGMVRVVYKAFLLGCALAISSMFAWLYYVSMRYPSPDMWVNVVITILACIGVLAPLGIACWTAFYLTSAFGAGPIWPGGRRPGESWLSHSLRLRRMRKMRNPANADRDELIIEALDTPSGSSHWNDSPSKLEQAYHAACGAIGAEHPDLVPILLRLSRAHERSANSYDAVMSQAAAVHLSRSFFGPGHSEHIAVSDRLHRLLELHPDLRTPRLEYFLSRAA